MKSTFAAGCFWGVEALFLQTKGVVSTEVGYTGGKTENPTYEEVCSGTSGHAEAIQVEYDPSIITYKELLVLFWDNHNPTTINQQGPDIGEQYRSAVFFHNEEQESIAKQMMEKLQDTAVQKFGNKIVTQIVPATKFYRAEEYHQKYLEKHPERFCSTTS